MHGQNRNSHALPRGTKLLYMWSHCYMLDTSEGRNSQILVEYLEGMIVDCATIDVTTPITKYQ